ncbi:hypothetical protein SynA1544_02710 [Synechococcus sp. A15-44]|nr:hypothetical protein SynA1544_02710 [Synechococcus sp. A15-44]
MIDGALPSRIGGEARELTLTGLAIQRSAVEGRVPFRGMKPEARLP